MFTTEGHILHLNSTHIKPPSAARRKLRPVDNSQCPAYRRRQLNWHASNRTALLGGIRSLPDFEFGRHLLGILPSSQLAEDDEPYWMPDGWCERPKHQQYVSQWCKFWSENTLNESRADVRFRPLCGRRKGLGRPTSRSSEIAASR